MASLLTTYLDVPTFLANLSIPIETASLVGANTSLHAAVSLGATSLQVDLEPGTTTAPAVGMAFLLDGPNSERVQVTAVTGASSPYTLTLASPGLLAGHAVGISLSQAGSGGCLADVLLRASARAEQICKQGPNAGPRSLWQASRTEIASGPNSWRAAFERDQTLLVRPYHFPVQSVATLAIQMGAQSAVGLDLTYLVIPDGGRLFKVPAPALLTPQGQQVQTVLTRAWPRSALFTLTYTYVGGPIAGATLDAVPYDIQQAIYYIALDLLSYRINQYGMVDIRRGDVNYRHAASVRGTNTGGVPEGLFVSQAREYLALYTAV